MRSLGLAARDGPAPPPPPSSAPPAGDPRLVARQISDARDVQAAMAALMALYQSGVV